MSTRELDTEEVAAIYDELLETYEREWNHQGHRSMHLGYHDDEHDDPAAASMNAMRVLSEAADISAGDRVLNVGCGAGEDAFWNVKAHDATVLGVNISEAQLDLARENAAAHDVAEAVEFRYDDFTTLETVEADSVDVFWALEALSHAADVGEVIAQAERVLRPDGRIAVSDLFLATDDLSAADEERVRTLEDGLGVRLGTVDEFSRALSEHGFTDVDFRQRTAAVEPSTKRRYTFSRVAGPISRLLVTLGRSSPVQARAYQASKAMHELVRDRVLEYHVVTACR